MNEWSREWLRPAIVRRRITQGVVVASLAAIVYWGVIASDRYVSEAHVIVQRTDVASGQSLDFSSILSGAGGGSRTDQLLLRDYLLSLDMLNKLDEKLDLRSHFSSWRQDPISAMWFKKIDQERFHQYFLNRVSVEFDDYAGVLVIKAQGYDPKTAHAITSMMVAEGERTMNELAHRLAQEQVSFVEKQLAEAASKLQQARTAVLAYQNKKGMVSPQSTATSMAATIDRLEMQRTELQARRNTLLGYLASKAPSVVEVDMQIDGIEKQIEKERARLAAPGGKTLNATVEEFQRLEMEAMFAQDVYKTALVSLETSRVEATRTLKKVSVLQQPTLPQYPMEPRRIYNITVFILVTLLLAGVIHLLAAIIRDHKD
ncbi:MAG: chain-length determining protein [Gammaproteobacteria bacterium]|nr:chain-length determining protein [Gammaproteobacteria bacterium]MBU1777341.1 chain-length determining protein [Gammaproteobacteria bacterium]